MTYRYEIRTIVVEDEEQNLNSICNKIVSLDNSFKIVGKAVNGQEALQKIEEIRPQVLFTDISMPVMGGMELIRRVRQSCPSIIIVIISGYSDFAYAQGAIKYGVFNYLLKPLESDALLETLVDIR
jgi:YesN/AraC family two-component response regulator